MGLFKAAKESIGTTMHDQWKDIISCENMTNDVFWRIPVFNACFGLFAWF